MQTTDTDGARSLRMLLTVLLVGGLVLSACSASDTSDGSGEEDEPTEDAAGDGSADESPDDDTSDSTESDASGLEALAQQAAEEGGLTWYCSTDPANCEDTIAGFNELYPDVRVDFLRLPSGQLATRYAEERAAGAILGDVASIADRLFYNEDPDWWVPLDEETIPALADWPQDHLIDGRVARIGLQWNVLSYNTDLVDEVPTTWEELLSDEYGNGQIAFGDPRNIITFLANIKVWRDELGEDWVRDFADQDFVLVDSVVPGSQRMAAGEFSFVLPNVVSVIEALKDEGAPVEWTTVTPITGPQHFAAISEGTDSPAAARLFVNFLLTPDGQSAFNSGDGASPLGASVEGALELPEGYVVVDWQAVIDERAELLELIGIEDV